MDGVLFKELTAVQRGRIFSTVAKEFASHRSMIITNLIGCEVNEALNTKWMALTAASQEHDILLDGLRMWFEQSGRPTGRELYDALADASCPEDLLQKYKTPFKVCYHNSRAPMWCRFPHTHLECLKLTQILILFNELFSHFASPDL